MSTRRPSLVLQHESDEPPRELVLSGVAAGVVTDGGWRGDRPDYAREYDAGTWRRRGKGYQYVVTLSAAARHDLLDYLESVHGAVASMTSEERGESGASELRALTKLLEAEGWWA